MRELVADAVQWVFMLLSRLGVTVPTLAIVLGDSLGRVRPMLLCGRTLHGRFVCLAMSQGKPDREGRILSLVWLILRVLMLRHLCLRQGTVQ